MARSGDAVIHMLECLICLKKILFHRCNCYRSEPTLFQNLEEFQLLCCLLNKL
jgi:hypothetical protein